MPTENFSAMLQASRDRITDLLASSTGLGRVGSAALRAAGSRGRQSFGEIYDAMNQQRLQSELVLGDMVRADAQLDMQMDQARRAEAMDMVTLAQTLTQGAEPGSMQRLLQHWDAAPEDFSAMEPGERISALISSASEAGIRPAAETFTSGRHIIERDPETGAYRIVFSAPVDRAGSGLPQTTGLPEGYMWGQDEAGNAVAMRIPGLDGVEDTPFRLLTPEEVAASGLPPGTVAQMDEEGRITVVDQTQRVEITPTGQARRVDEVAGTVAGVPIGYTPPPTTPVDRPLLGDVSVFGGVAPVGEALEQFTFGAFGSDEERNTARQNFRLLREDLIAAFARSDRPSNYAQQRVEELLPSSGVFESQAHAYDQLAATYRDLEREVADDTAIINNPLATPEMQGEAQQRVMAAQRAMAQIGDPSQFPRPGSVQGEPTSTAAETWAQIRNAPSGIGQQVWEGLSGPERADLVSAWPNMTARERELFQ